MGAWVGTSGSISIRIPPSNREGAAAAFTGIGWLTEAGSCAAAGTTCITFVGWEVGATLTTDPGARFALTGTTSEEGCASWTVCNVGKTLSLKTLLSSTSSGTRASRSASSFIKMSFASSMTITPLPESLFSGLGSGLDGLEAFGRFTWKLGMGLTGDVAFGLELKWFEIADTGVPCSEGPCISPSGLRPSGATTRLCESGLLGVFTGFTSFRVGNEGVAADRLPDREERCGLPSEGTAAAERGDRLDAWDSVAEGFVSTPDSTMDARRFGYGKDSTAGSARTASGPGWALGSGSSCWSQ